MGGEGGGRRSRGKRRARYKVKKQEVEEYGSGRKRRREGCTNKEGAG
jgi:hypothetical protein